MRKLIPIVPRSNLFLVPYGHGNDLRFARLFQETWKRIPLWGRRRMLNYWRKDDEFRLMIGVPKIHPGQRVSVLRMVSSLVLPRIELVYGWTGPSGDTIVYPGGRKRLQRVLGACIAEGRRLRFCSQHVDKMPDNVVRDVIAHELAHVHQYAIGLKRRFGYEPDKRDLEEDANHVAGIWGFEVDSIEEYGITVLG